MLGGVQDIPPRTATDAYLARAASSGRAVRLDVVFDVDLGELVDGHRVIARGVEMASSGAVLHYEFVPGVTEAETGRKGMFWYWTLSGDTAQTSGMTRLEAISSKSVGSEKLWMGETHVAPATNSGDHHHGEAETAIYVLTGNPAFVFADGDQEVRLETEPGDYIFVPPYVPHREENPGAEEAVVVIARSSQEGVVVNLPSLWAPVDRP